MANLSAMSGMWLIDPRAGQMIQSGITERQKASEDFPRVWTAANREQTKMPKAVAVLPMTGILEPRASDYTYYFGGTSTEAYGEAFDRAIANPDVKAVVLDCYTPGGMVYGTPELARKIYNARGTKPIVGIANPMAASAGLWNICAADRVYVTPSGDIGSHGVFMMHMDQSKAMEDMGLKVTYVSAGKYKVEGNPFEPLSDEARADMQREVDDIMGEFTAALATYRGKSQSHVLENFGQGRLLSSKAAVAAGMADGIATFEQVVSRLLTGHIRTDKAAACDDWETPCASVFDDPKPEPVVVPEEPAKKYGNADLLRRKLEVTRRQ